MDTIGKKVYDKKDYDSIQIMQMEERGKHMKIIKRIAALLLTVALMVPCISEVVLAADGVIYFSDLETTVGATFTITGTVVNRTGSLGNVTVEMSYDTAYMQFLSGDGVNADSDGNLTYTGTASGDTLEFTMEFQALQEGSTRMEQGTATVTTADGSTLECDSGYADITIGPGDPSLIVQSGNTTEVTVDGQTYTLSEDFTDNAIPQGFSRGEFTYNDTTYAGAVQESAGVTLAYLVDSSDEGDFWVYNADDSSFSPCEEVMISDTYSLLLMDGTNAVSLPSSYSDSAIEISGKEIPAWSSPDREGFYVLYGVNSDGDASLYLFDSLEHTYQRMETPASQSSDGNSSSGLWDRISGFITDHLLWIVVGVACFAVIILVFLIVLGVKLLHRNKELDDLYDEIDAGQDDRPAARNSNRNQFLRSQDDDDLDDDYYDDDEYFDDDDDDDYYEDDYYEDDELDDLRKEFQSSRKDSGHQYDDYYDEDDFEEDAPALSRRKSGKKNDTYEMDFIDLD